MSVERNYFDNIQKLEQENKQLKEELYSSRTFLADSQKHCEDLDNKHEEYRKYQKELIDSWEAKAHGLKKKLEKIRDRADIWDGKESGWYGKKLKEILD